MVSFSCENCGDTLKKQKLDPHRNQCRGAPFTCLDCSTTFYGTDYRSHTSCVSEAQKYEKTVYKGDKNAKQNKRKSVSILEPTENNAIVPRRAYVEDEADIENPPPAVPTPPPAVRENPRDSVFDYMVEDDQPNTPKITFASAKDRESKEMKMKNGAPPLFNESRTSSRNGSRDSEDQLHNEEFTQNGFSYGSEAINPRTMQDMNGSYLSLDFMTPAAKAARLKLDGKMAITPGHSRTNSGSEKKRKRGQSAPDAEGDLAMTGTETQFTIVDTPAVAHSGLTGGLQRMITDDSGFYPRFDSDDDRRKAHRDERRKSRHNADPTSPLKRSRHTKEKAEKEEGLGINLKGRAAKALSMVGGVLLPSQQVQDGHASKTRRRASSSDHYARAEPRELAGEIKRERKKHKVHQNNGASSNNHRSSRHASHEPPEGRKMKTLEYHKNHDVSGSDSDEQGDKQRNGDVVVFGAEEKQKRKCEVFLANIPRIEESEKGYSVHKALKRWHKQSDHHGMGEKSGSEEDLWRGLRLRKNERGEVVVFWAGGLGD